MTEARRALRCAVYTRKSSEQGLEQDFNSLAAQREAAESYIRSQRHEGWQLVKAHYDDGGLSGGTLERPALKRLLGDIRAGRIDVVVVYKVDRLTRSLADFAKLVEIFDAHRVSFVSVTQQFNTTTSMGRLTLNVLLSFAQFEREVTGERIRDKFAASRRKGMWMGGAPPIGYDVKNRKLVVSPAEAKIVNLIFRRYLSLGCAAKVTRALTAEGCRTKRYVSGSNRTVGGRPFSRGHLYWILANRVYRGEAVHKGKAYPGEHQAIVSKDLWDRVQAKLAANRRDRRAGKGVSFPSLLKGLLWDDAGNRMSPSHACRHGRRYRYYVSQALLQHRQERGGSVLRLPAHELEQRVAEAVLGWAARNAASGPEKKRILRLAGRERDLFIRRRVEKVVVSDGSIQIQMKSDPPARHGRRTVKPAVIQVPFEIVRRGGAKRILVDGRVIPPKGPSPALVKAVARGHRWREQLLAGEMRSVGEIAKRERISPAYVGRILPLGFLAPDIVQAIVSGTRPAGWAVNDPPRVLPVDWGVQRRLFGL